MEKESLEARRALPPALAARLAAPQLPALNGVRAIAVLLVILYHFGFEAIPGPLGVLIFFVLSGFLITWLLLAEDEETGGVSLARFYLRRALRIFPAFYAFFLLSAAALTVTGRELPWGHALSALLYLGNYYDALWQPPPSFVSHTWSLAIEEQFYLLWPALFIRYRRDLRTLTWLLVGLIGATWVHRGVLYLSGVDPQYMYYALDTRLDHLLVGCLLAVLLKRGALQSLWSFLCASAWRPALTLLLLAGSVALRYRFGYTYRNLVGFAVEPLLVAFLLVQLIRFSDHPAWRWLNAPVPDYLGKLSYSLYLYQQITLLPVRELLAGTPVVAQLAAGLLVTLAVAMGSFYLIERPFLALKHRLSFRPAGRPRAARSAPPRPGQALAAALPPPRPATAAPDR